MAGFLYCIPGSWKPADITWAVLDRFGLAHAFESKPQAWPHERGPTGGPGSVLCEPRRLAGARQVYDADGQVWRQIPRSEAWIGYNREAPPTEADLRRATMMPGALVRMREGDWTIPNGLTLDADTGLRCPLPHRYEYGDDGQWKAGAVLPQHRHFKALAMGLFDLMRGADTEDAKLVGDATPPGLVAAILGVNYVVSDIEVAILELIDSTIWEPVRDAVVDVRGREAIKKKQAPAT